MNLKTIALLLCFAAFPMLASAQSTEIGSATARKWYAPDAVTLQFAGNIGMFSIAPSYSFAQDSLMLNCSMAMCPGLMRKRRCTRSR